MRRDVPAHPAIFGSRPAGFFRLPRRSSTYPTYLQLLHRPGQCGGRACRTCQDVPRRAKDAAGSAPLGCAPQSGLSEQTSRKIVGESGLAASDGGRVRVQRLVGASLVKEDASLGRG
jgi:hypothetical protein